MKTSFTKILSASLALCFAIDASAYDFEDGGVYYTITSETDKTVEVTSGDDGRGNLAIPETVNINGTDYAVTTIGNNAFADLIRRSSITLGNSITAIGDSAFINSSISSIVIPDGVETIGDCAFMNCSSLSSVTLGSNLTSLGDSLFLYCRRLASIDIPDGVTEMGSHIFFGCTALTSVTLPENLTAINEFSFNGCQYLESVNIPDGVVSIGDYAFQDCMSIASITIPEGVETIGDYAFSGTWLMEIYCRATTPPACGTNSLNILVAHTCKLYVPTGTAEAYRSAAEWNRLGGNIEETDFATTGAYDFEADGIYYNITSETTAEVTFEISEFTPTGNYTGSITIPATASDGETAYTVTAIGYNAFYKCSGLTEITLPETIETIGEMAFIGCGNLESITVPDRVTEIGASAFESCGALTAATLPESLETIGGKAFFGCGNLASVNIPDAISEIKANTFSGCSSLASIDIPDGVTAIGSYAFSSCSSLASVDIPDGVTSIGEGAFSGCNSLESIIIPDAISEIGASTFSRCTALAEVTLPENLESIGDGAFSSCSSLIGITIPGSVVSIGSNAFNACTALAEITSLATEPPVCGSGCFTLVDQENCTLYVPEGTADDYKAANVWKDFLNIVETDFAGTEEIAAEAAVDVKVYAAAGCIVVENAAAGTPIAVYTADGVLIYGGVVSDTRTEIPAPAGKLYIIKCGNAVFKTVM